MSEGVSADGRDMLKS